MNITKKHGGNILTKIDFGCVDQQNFLLQVLYDSAKKRFEEDDEAPSF